MKIKKITTYLAFLLIGLLIGGFLFNTSSDNQEEHLVDKAIEGKWSCSMHPQIDGKEGEKCPLCAMDLVFTAGSVNMGQNHFEMSEDALALAKIQTIKVGRANSFESRIKLSGIITTNKRTDAVQTTLYDGRLDRLYFNTIGEKVYKGQEIGQIYSPELYLGQDRLFASLNIRESHPELFATARYSMGLWKITDEQIDSMLNSGKPMFDFPLYSDVSGTITQVFAEEGNFYELGRPLFQVSDLRKVWAVFDAYEDQLPLMKSGNTIEVYIPAYNEQINAKIDLVEPILKPEERVASVRVVLDNKNGRFKPGMFVEGLVDALASIESLTVPKSTVLWTGKRSIVYRVSKFNPNAFEIVEVELGKSYDGYYEILSGLEIGDEIVYDGAFVIDAAAQLQGKKSMMTFDQGINTGGEQFDGNQLKDIKDRVELSVENKGDFKKLLGAYFDFKDALVASDFSQSKVHINEVNSFLKSLKNGNGQLEEKLNPLQNSLELLVNSSDIETIRHHFKPFSKSFIDFTKSINDFEEKIYVQFCPMADGNKGATWLSLEKEIRNPYFGNKMLFCGSIQEEITQQ